MQQSRPVFERAPPLIWRLVTGCGRTHARMSRIIGRADDMIIIRGVNIFPSQIEEALTGIENVLAVIGGFHLTGRIFEPIIQPTIQALKEINPKVIVPQHCTGWKATHEIAREFPDAYIANSVGTTFVL